MQLRYVGVVWTFVVFTLGVTLSPTEAYGRGPLRRFFGGLRERRLERLESRSQAGGHQIISPFGFGGGLGYQRYIDPGFGGFGYGGFDYYGGGFDPFLGFSQQFGNNNPQACNHLGGRQWGEWKGKIWRPEQIGWQGSGVVIRTAEGTTLAVSGFHTTCGSWSGGQCADPLYLRPGWAGRGVHLRGWKTPLVGLDGQCHWALEVSSFNWWDGGAGSATY